MRPAVGRARGAPNAAGALSRRAAEQALRVLARRDGAALVVSTSRTSARTPR
jgi:hypothetical protein